MYLIGIALAALALAGCGPRTPNAAAETPFVPPTVTQSLLPPAATAPPEGYPGTQAPPPATGTPISYPDVASSPTAMPTLEAYPSGGATPTAQPPAATATFEPAFITYRDFEIVPAQSTVRVGQQVNFLIESASGAFHQPYAGAAAPFIFEAPPNMGNGVSWPFTFNTAQTLTLLCGYHANMRATLTITP
jgi:plastocyanin